MAGRLSSFGWMDDSYQLLSKANYLTDTNWGVCFVPWSLAPSAFKFWGFFAFRSCSTDGNLPLEKDKYYDSSICKYDQQK